MKTTNKQTKKTRFFTEIIKNHKDIILFIGAFLFGVALVAIATCGFRPNCAPYRKTAIALGSRGIQWYAVFILTGIVVAGMMGSHEWDRFRFSKDKLLTAMIIIVPGAIIMSRLYYVAFDPDKSNYKSFIDVINIAQGGLSIHGAFIGAVLMAIPISASKRFNFKILPVLDTVVIGFLIGQIFGRWGNFMNQEAHGGPMTGSSMLSMLPPFIKAQQTYGGVTYHPTFLYESFFNFLLLVSLLVYRRMRILKVGDMFSMYLFYYGILRGLLIEPMRTDPLKVAGININQYPQMAAYIIIAIIIFIATRLYYKKKEKTLPYYYDISNPWSKERLSERSLKMVVLDLDGTILNSEEAIKSCAKETLEQGLGLKDLKHEDMKMFIGPTLTESFSKFTDNKEKIDEMKKAFNNNFDKYHTKKDIKFYKGVFTLLYKLKADGYMLGIVTSKKRKHTDITLDMYKVTDLFDITVTRDEVENPKPNKEALELIKESCNLKADELIYIGDHEYDIMCANNANVKSVIVNHSNRLPEAFDAKPTRVAMSISDIYGIVGGYNNEV